MSVVRLSGYGCGCSPDTTGHETGLTSGAEFPCVVFDERLGPAAGQGVPWHWHDEFEIMLVVDGAMHMRSEGGMALLAPGDAVFFNARVSHMAAGAPFASIRSLVFDPSMVAGAPGSVFARRYVDPVLAADGVRFHVWQGSAADDVAREVSRVVAAAESERFLYELDVRDALSRCVARLAQELCQEGGARSRGTRVQIRRMEKMRDFIEANYAEPVEISDIARAADVSERECQRCFRATLGESPSRFLAARRLAHAAAMLANSPDMPIASVARSVGIADASNFARRFRSAYGMTPREYRSRFA